MSKKPSANQPNPDAVKAQRAQILGFIAGAVIVLLLAGFAVKRSTASPAVPEAAPAVEASAIPQAAAAQPAATPEAAPAATGKFKRITADELKALHDKGQVMIIDVRDMDQYLAQHIDGAGQIPLALLEGEISYMPKDKLIALYCTCPAEESSGTGAEILQHGGITNVVALQGGLAAWAEKGYPTKSGQS